MSRKRKDKSKRIPTRHHRFPTALMPGKIPDNSPDNISIVSLKQHQHYNALFGHRDPKQVADVLNRIWISTKFRMIAVNREIGLTVSEVLALKEEMEAQPMS